MWTLQRVKAVLLACLWSLIFTLAIVTGHTAVISIHRVLDEVYPVCEMVIVCLLWQPCVTLQPKTVQLVEYAPEKRMTAAQALAHPLISASRVGKTLLRAKTLGSAATEAAASFTEPWLSSAASGAKFDVVVVLPGRVSVPRFAVVG